MSAALAVVPGKQKRLYRRGKTWSKADRKAAWGKRWFPFKGELHFDLWRILPPAPEHAIVLLILSNSKAVERRYTEQISNQYFAKAAGVDVRYVQTTIEILIAKGIIAERSPGSGEYEALVDKWVDIESAPRRKPVRGAGEPDEGEGEEEEEGELAPAAHAPRVEKLVLRPGEKPSKIELGGGRSLLPVMKASRPVGLELTDRSGAMRLVVRDVRGEPKRRTIREEIVNEPVKSVTSKKRSEELFASSDPKPGNRIQAALVKVAEITGTEKPGVGTGGAILQDCQKLSECAEEDVIVAMRMKLPEARTMNKPVAYYRKVLPTEVEKLMRLKAQGIDVKRMSRTEVDLERQVRRMKENPLWAE